MTTFVNIFFLVFAALFPIVNPLSNVPIFIQMTHGNAPCVRNVMSRDIAIGGFLLLLVSLFLGSHILVFFGITLPVVRIAGGAVIFIMGWRLLNQGDNPIEDQPNHHETSGLDQSFYPLTMPLTVGPGSIATAIALGSQWPIELARFRHLLLEIGAIVTGLAAISVCVYLCYRFSDRIVRVLGRTGTNVFMRLSAFILLCIGLQIAWDGLSTLLGLPAG